MEADWEFEIGNDAPIIEAHWAGFVDLRVEPARASQLAETQQLPGLAEALERLNAINSPVWTCKTDVFVPGHIDPDELDAAGEESSHSIACYVDLLMRSDQQWNLPFKAERSCKVLCAQLRNIPLRCCRIDLIVRQAHIESDLNDLGATAYLSACGSTESGARLQLTECLSQFAKLLVPEPKRDSRTNGVAVFG
ncbi:hypothetical protein P8935_09765 [Telmatobacter sp. DSM 110680]|uniref:Uncharacterized protein n=1 Tax=Telmatobacter sp. DSM 110680 TaxID=3036704 RepID=A0AAU7DQM5_9BACT